MSGSFSFSFSGDDIDVDLDDGPREKQHQDRNQRTEQDYDGVAAQGRAALQHPTTAASLKSSSNSSAFPVQGRPQLPPTRHDLGEMLSTLPSKIAYGVLEVELDDGAGVVRLPRRELWDVRLQLAAEDDRIGTGGGDGGPTENDQDDTGLGKHDVRSGIYEGGFKSWESSVDLVKVLAKEDISPAVARTRRPVRMIELGCGTALPSVAVFQWASSPATTSLFPLILTLADYNPSVLYLVTLPNLILSWALYHQDGSQLLRDAFSAEEGELELSDEVKAAFRAALNDSCISLSFLSGGWAPGFVELLYDDRLGPEASFSTSSGDVSTVVVGAETIYSPFALAAFSDTLLSVLRREKNERPGRGAAGVVAAKRHYFGVGGSLDDFVDRMTVSGADVRWLREETEGVRRGVVHCLLP